MNATEGKVCCFGFPFQVFDLWSVCMFSWLTGKMAIILTASITASIQQVCSFL